MSEVIQLQPNHADHISGYRLEYLEKMFKEEPVIAQPKYDGERMLIHFVGDKVFCTSRRISKKTGEFTRLEDKLPQLLRSYSQNSSLQYTVLDCECYARNWSESASVLHSLPERAIELQKTIQIKFAVFDCLYADGQDIRGSKYIDRLLQAAKTVQALDIPGMHLASFMDENFSVNSYTKTSFINSFDEAMTCMQNAIDAGYEGVVVKSLMRAYYDKAASLKCKKFETVDVVVCDYKPGTGKYADTVGALIVGYYDNGNIVPIARVNCGTDADRNMWRDNWNELKGTVLEVKCQEITGRSLRHPVYIRQRLDKNASDCTKEMIFKEDV